MAIGGYNQLSLTSLNTQLYVEAYQFQSARAALYAYLSAENIKTLYVPNYICDSIFPALKSLNIEVEFYSINEQLLPEKILDLLHSNDSKILLVNYFGLLNEKIKELTALEPEIFIIDNSQALFCEHIEGTTSIYSPRKFLGIPDGGFLRTSTHINMPELFFDSSKNIGHLLLRDAGHTQAGYSRFLEAEKALECFIPKRISAISTHLIKCSDISVMKEKRKRNYALLDKEFKSLNQLHFPMNDQTPLCYPLKLMFKVDTILDELIENSIYLPRYWCSDCSGVIGKSMYDFTLFLPVDERVTVADILYLVKLIKDKL